MAAPIHPAAELFRTFKDSERDRLEDSIDSRGDIIDPLVVYDEQLLDGRHRRETCRKLGITPKFIILPSDQDPWQFVLDKHIHRELTPSERVATALDYSRKATQLQGLSDRKKIKAAAESFAVSVAYIDKLIRLEKELGPNTVEEAKSGLWNISVRYKDMFPSTQQATPKGDLIKVLDKAQKSLDGEIQAAIAAQIPLSKQDLLDLQLKARDLRRSMRQLKSLVK